MAIYNKIGKTYDATRRADPFIASRLRFYLDLNNHGKYLDVACGTGNYTTYLAEIGGFWNGIDQSAEMIEKAKEKSDRVKWHQADAAALSFDDASFDGAICTLAIHHFNNLEMAFGEVRRDLKNSSQFVIFTSTPEQTGNYWLAEYFPQAINKSAEVLPDLKTVFDTLRNAGFDSIETEPYSVRENLEDLFLYSGKFKPEMYLDENFRANISTFSLIAKQSEIESGCGHLQADIQSGKIGDIITKHEQEGDYLFVIAQN